MSSSLAGLGLRPHPSGLPLRRSFRICVAPDFAPDRVNPAMLLLRATATPIRKNAASIAPTLPGGAGYRPAVTASDIQDGWVKPPRFVRWWTEAADSTWLQRA